MADRCVLCEKVITAANRLVLVRGKVHEAHCSESCLQDSVRKHRAARAATLRRWLLPSLAVVLVLGGGGLLWKRFHAPPKVAIGTVAPEPLRAVPEPLPAGPPVFGPAWPPTDADWLAAFQDSQWVFPLPGPVRRLLKIDRRILGPEPPKNHPPVCREEGRCGVDLGGELWGEHVYAVHDGVVDRVLQNGGSEERGGQFVRVAHFGGMVFTHYFHLAAVPRGIVRGARVKAGEVIGLVGDTGVEGARRHLHFAFSIRPSSDFPDVYWDPSPWMERWPLRLPSHGTVAGLVAPEQEQKMAQRRRSR